MVELSIDEKYALEVEKSERDHHKPTAAAMLGHVLANIFYEKIRLKQAGQYAKKASYCAEFRKIALKEDGWFDEISDALLNENELVPTTLDEFVTYHKFIETDPKAKYWSDEALLESFIRDFQSQNLFITRAIKLAQKEEKYALEVVIRELYGYNLAIIRYFAGELGKTVAEFMEEEDDD
ncbi:DNA-binding protein [Lactococcus kimchii]|uniref:DNA-binding protein n=1 Tax=Lactococcus sp. S-13 TaxID=2507158 RepID=UPI0010237431|nr:DNA-binding protein [Lactococcus sp. S-13]RZI48378.1 DNA-binding protein [Lactococcus sp. S-13]